MRGRWGDVGLGGGGGRSALLSSVRASTAAEESPDAFSPVSPVVLAPGALGAFVRSESAATVNDAADTAASLADAAIFTTEKQECQY